MNSVIKTVLQYIARPFIEKKIEEYQSTNYYKEPRPHPAQVSSQVSKLGVGVSITMLTQVESVEATVAYILILLVNLAFLYYPEKNRNPY